MVTGMLDLTGLLEQGPGNERLPLRRRLTPPASPALPPPDVLNGIAWDAQRGTFLVTGKLWPVLFELRVSEPC